MADARNNDNSRKRRRIWPQSSHQAANYAVREQTPNPKAFPANVIPPAPEAAQQSHWAQSRFILPSQHGQIQEEEQDEEQDDDGVKGAVGFDCPIRAGPGSRCKWKPVDGSDGFVNITRMKAHVGDHGLKCPDCGLFFKAFVRFDNHRSYKSCTEHGAATYKKGPQFPLTQTPDQLYDFFKRAESGKPPETIWREGYQVLFPRSQLPSPYYRANTARQQVLQHSSAYERSSPAVVSNVRQAGAERSTVTRSAPDEPGLGSSSNQRPDETDQSNMGSPGFEAPFDPVNALGTPSLTGLSLNHMPDWYNSGFELCEDLFEAGTGGDEMNMFPNPGNEDYSVGPLNESVLQSNGFASIDPAAGLSSSSVSEHVPVAEPGVSHAPSKSTAPSHTGANGTTTSTESAAAGHGDRKHNSIMGIHGPPSPPRELTAETEVMDTDMITQLRNKLHKFQIHGRTIQDKTENCRLDLLMHGRQETERHHSVRRTYVTSMIAMFEGEGGRIF